MKTTEKLEITAYALGAIAIFTLVQSPVLNVIAVLMAIRMLFRLKALTGKKS